MSHTMTCWKEVAQFLGKGVRTVQRWEHEIGLPVHRPNGTRKGVILAYPDEIEAWVRTSLKSRTVSEPRVLRKELAAAREENKLLRAMLIRTPHTSAFVPMSGSTDVEDGQDELLQSRCASVVSRNNTLRLQSLHVLDEARTMREARRIQRVQSVQ